jgi:hypothetical protein
MHPPSWYVRQARAAALGYFWLPCPSCGNHFSGEEWQIEEGDAAHFASLPAAPEPDDPPHEESAFGICSACTYAGIGCRAYAERYQRYHPGCEAVDPPPPGVAYTMIHRSKTIRVERSR